MKVRMADDRRWGSVRPGYDHGRFVAHVECGQCGAHKRWSAQSQPRPDVVVKKIEACGWITGKRTVCPDCQTKSKEKNVNAKATVTPIKPATPTPDARQARLDAHDLIRMSFDITKGCYTDGYSDQRVADETGVGVQWVKTRREEEFGPLKEPGEIGALRQELSDATSLVDQVRAKLDALCKRMGWAA